MGSYTPSATLFDQTVHTIPIPESIRSTGKPTLEIIAEGASFLHKDGIIILDNAISTAHIDTLNNKLSPEALEIANDPNHHFNFGKHTRNMDQAPPPTKELIFKDIWCNPFASAILSAVMGPRPVIHYANGNTALKASPEGRQPVHSDCEFAHPAYFPFACVINICLVDVTPENGGTEVWVGSHHVSVKEAHNRLKPGDKDTDRDAQNPNNAGGDDAADDEPPIDDEFDGEGLLTIKPKPLEQRRQHSPPIQLSCKKGSLIIRDLRLWHAGMPNLTDEPRIMLAFVASPPWWRGKSKILLPAAVKDLVTRWAEEDREGDANSEEEGIYGGGFAYAADYIGGEVDHKKLSSGGVDFGTGSLALQREQGVMSRWAEYRPRWY